MISTAKLKANRANARTSTGPTSATGRARSAGNARRHGLNVPISEDSALAHQAETLARRIAGQGASVETLHLARIVADAQVELLRIRNAKGQLKDHTTTDLVGAAATLDDYERRTLSRRNRAIQNLDCHRVLQAVSRR
jgi:hypothetical protein